MRHVRVKRFAVCSSVRSVRHAARLQQTMKVLLSCPAKLLKADLVISRSACTACKSQTTITKVLPS